MRKLRGNKRLPTSHQTKPTIDVWLSRASHLAQIGLLTVTVFIYLYTVVPVYEKNSLEKEIAKKELELKANRKQLELNYIQLRHDLVVSYIFYTGAKCTGILKPFSLPPLDDKHVTDLHEKLPEVFDLDITNCLKSEAENRESLKILRSRDYTTLSNEIEVISEKLEEQRKVRIQEYVNYPNQVKSNPALLPALDENSFVGRLLIHTKGIFTASELDQKIYDARLNQGLAEIKAAYIADIQTALKGLGKIVWS